jgi:hypothetical protein
LVAVHLGEPAQDRDQHDVVPGGEAIQDLVIPGHVDLVGGLSGPLIWLLAAIVSTVALNRPHVTELGHGVWFGVCTGSSRGTGW